MKRLLQDLCHFVNPKLCLHCKKPLETSVEHLCLMCTSRISNPLNFPWNIEQNQKIKVSEKILIYIVFNYPKGGSLQSLLKALKYRNNKFIGSYLFFLSRKHIRFLIKPELVCCIPLHRKKAEIRGYNQLHIYSNHIAEYLNIPFEASLLRRTENNPSQAERKVHDKNSYLSNISFKYCGKKQFKNKNILVIDDLITSGQTIRSAIKSLKEAHGYKIQILSIASRVS